MIYGIVYSANFHCGEEESERWGGCMADAKEHTHTKWKRNREQQRLQCDAVFMRGNDISTTSDSENGKILRKLLRMANKMLKFCLWQLQHANLFSADKYYIFWDVLWDNCNGTDVVVTSQNVEWAFDAFTEQWLVTFVPKWEDSHIHTYIHPMQHYTCA